MRKTVTLFVGPPKVGKSLLLQQMLTSLASGVAWLGRSVEHVKTFGLLTEDPQEELNKRQLAINEHYGISAADLELDMSWDAREGKEATLVTFDRGGDHLQFTPLWYQVWQFVADLGVEAVGLDTAAVVFAGNENYRSQVTAFLRALVVQAIICNCGIVLTAHPGKGNTGYSGSSGWLASSRSAITLNRPHDYDPDVGPHNARVLRNLGANYSAGIAVQHLEYRDGVIVPVDTPELARSTKALPLNLTERMDLEYRLLGLLKVLRTNGVRIPADDILPTGLPARARKTATFSKVPLQDLCAAQQALIDSGRILRVSIGGRCVLRAADSTPFDGEEAWLF